MNVDLDDVVGLVRERRVVTRAEVVNSFSLGISEVIAESVVCIDENCCDVSSKSVYVGKVVGDENIVVVGSESIGVVSEDRDVIVVDFSKSERSVDGESDVYSGNAVLEKSDEKCGSVGECERCVIGRVVLGIVDDGIRCVVGDASLVTNNGKEELGLLISTKVLLWPISPMEDTMVVSSATNVEL